MADIKSILEERGKSYGSFVTQAELSNALYKTWFDHFCQVQKRAPLSPYISEGLLMVMHKLARLGNGNHKHIDSWRDIAGYATLIANELEKEDCGASKSYSEC